MSLLPETLNSFINQLDNVIVFRQGKIVHQKLSEAFLDLTIETQKTVSKLTDYLKPSNDIETVNTKTNNSYLSINVPSSFNEASAVHVFYLADQASLVHETEIYVNQSGHFNFFEYIYSDAAYTVNLVSNSLVEANAFLGYTSLSNMPETGANAIVRNAFIKRYGKADYTNGAFAKSITHQENNIHLIEDYAFANSKTIALTANKQEALIKTYVSHEAPHTEGHINHFGVANHDSVLLFEGTGKIHKNMRKSVARQSNKGIVIGENARLDANPFLLIDEYDVEASHGAAIGKIDEEQLYYLMSRGLSHKDAERLIIKGFLAPLKVVIQSDTIFEHIQALLSDKIQ